MKKLYQILTERRKQNVQRYLDEAAEMTQRLVEFHQGIPETPPKLEGSRILVLMVGTSRCLYAALYALYLSYQLKAELYVLHKGNLASFILEQANELQVSIPFTHRIDHVRLEELKELVNEKDITLIVTAGGLPNARELLNHLNIPILFTRS